MAKSNSNSSRPTPLKAPAARKITAKALVKTESMPVDLKKKSNSDSQRKSASEIHQLRDKQGRIVAILEELEKVYVDSFEGLDYSNPLQLLVATILSAQSTDKLVNTVTPALFKKYRGAEDYTRVPVEELEQDIRSTGYYRSKAKHIQGCCAMLIDKYGGQVPDTMEELIQLPGVGRKTANCVLSQCFGQQGLTVDTHVNRIANLLGLVESTDPVKIEYALMEIVPHQRWNRFNELIITHGRKTCIARRPQCGICVIVDLCPSRQA